MLRLPTHSRVRLATPLSPALDAVESRIRDGSLVHGYVQVRCEEKAEAFLFILRGSIFCAGQFADDRFGALPVSTFMGKLGSAASIDLCTTDLPLFLCTAVLFRKAPAAQIPVRLVDSAALLEQIRQTGKDAVLVIHRDTARSLIFCHGGAPQAIYPAADASFPEGDTLTDRIIEYIYTTGSPDGTVLNLYDEIRMPPAADADKPLSYFRNSSWADASSCLGYVIVKLSERSVFRYPITTDVFTIGRGAPNDLPLDNLSVSRQHARAQRVGAELHIEDLGSENGLRIDDKPVKQARLRPDDTVAVGRYTLIYREHLLPQDAPVANAPRHHAMLPEIDNTVATAAPDNAPDLEHNGRRLPLKKPVIEVGSGKACDLRIAGVFVAPTHFRIYRESSGRFRLEHVAGRKSVQVNGKTVKTVHLNNGDEISVGSERIRFLARTSNS